MPIQLTVMSLDFDSSISPMTQVYEKDEITLGRSATNDLVLDRPEISGVHAKLWVAPSANSGEPVLLVRDLGSSNGTMVENRALKGQAEAEVQPNQRIIIGNYLIKPVLKGETQSAVSQALNPETESVKPSADKKVKKNISIQKNEKSDTKIMTLEKASETVTDSSPPVVTKSNISSKKVSAREAVRAGAEELASITEGTASVKTTSTKESKPIVSTLASGSSSIDSVTKPVAEFVLDSGDVVFDFDAVALYSLKGKITHNAKALAGVKVRLRSGASEVTNMSGEYAFSDIPEQTAVVLSVEKKGYSFKQNEVDLGSLTANLEQNFEASGLYAVSGKLAHKGKALAGVKVDAGALGSIRTDMDGAFSFDEIEEGTSYALKVIKEGYSFDIQEVTGIVSAEGAPIEFTATKLHEITGRVLHQGVPLAGVTIDGGSELGTTETDKNGRYVFSNVPEDKKYTLTARKDKYSFRLNSK